MIWLCDCPNSDQGLVRPLVLGDGCVVLMCDSGGEVWLRPSDVGVAEPYYPQQPEWKVVCSISVAPGTTRWATNDELSVLDWDARWQESSTRYPRLRASGGSSGAARSAHR